VRVAQKLDLEALYANIQTKLSVYSRRPYVVPSGLSSDDIDNWWDNLEQAEKERGRSVRNHMFKFIAKVKTGISEEQLREIEASFHHFDTNGSGDLDQQEFKAALVALGIPFKNDDELRRVFLQLSQGNQRISKEQFVNYMISISEDTDTAEEIKSSFKFVADQSIEITPAQLQVPPLDEEDIFYLVNRMPQASRENTFDYANYTDQSFKLD